MFHLYADKNQLKVKKGELVTSGSVNVYPVRFEFSGDWAGLERTAVFRGGGEARSVLLDDTGECTVPWEVLQKPAVLLEVGVYGTQNGDTVLPTVWASLGTVLPGAAPGEDAQPPTPDLWKLALAEKQDKLTGRPGQVVGFDENGNAAAQDNRVSDHRQLTGREAADQHPIGAVTGLKEALASIPVPMTADQLRKILMNGGQENA